MDFKTYLLQKVSKTTAQNYSGKLLRIIRRLEANGQNIDFFSLDDLYQLKADFKNEGLSASSIRQNFKTISYYYGYIQRKEDPVRLMKFKKRQLTLPTNTLTKEELLDIYKSYNIYRLKDRRDIVILGLVIFQGVKRAEIEQIEVHHVNLTDASIYIPSTSQTNARVIPLEAVQMKYLSDYMYDVREVLLNNKKKETSRLFFSLGNGHTMDNVLQANLNRLRQSNSYFKNYLQLRESRIILWLKEYGTRKSLYLSGMRFASSLERYQTKDVEALRQKLNVIHPLDKAR